MAREYVRLTPETSWGVFNGAGTPVVVQLTDSNQQTVRKVPQFWGPLRSAGGYNRRIKKGSSRYAVSGGLTNLIVYGSQASAWASWLTPVATAGVYSLPSMTLDHAIVLEDAANTTLYARYLGLVVVQADFSVDSQSQLMRLNFSQLIGKSVATITVADFPEPLATDYPSDAPYVLEHAPSLTVGSSRAEFDSLKVSIQNKVDATFFNASTITRAKYAGRDVDWEATFPYVLAADRAAFEGVTAVAGSATFTNGAHSLSFNFESQNFLDQVGDQLDMDKLFLQNLKLQSFFDSSAGTPTDFSLSAT